MAGTAEFKSLLIDSRTELQRRLSAIELDVKNETNEISKDSEEQSIERENDEVIDALGNSARAELALIDQALSRIEHGNYFECIECGGQINEDRLRSVPYTSLCLKCAEQQENTERGSTDAT